MRMAGGPVVGHRSHSRLHGDAGVPQGVGDASLSSWMTRDSSDRSDVGPLLSPELSERLPSDRLRACRPAAHPVPASPHNGRSHRSTQLHDRSREDREMSRASGERQSVLGDGADPRLASPARGPPWPQGMLGETFGEVGQAEIGVGPARSVSAITRRVEGIGVRPMITVCIPSFVVAGASNRMLSGRSTGVFM